MSVGEIAGLIAAIALLLFVILCAVPLLKLGRVLEELRRTVRELGDESVPILTELRGTVSATNTELEKLAVVTDDAAKVSGHATVVSDNVAQLATLFRDTLAGPLHKIAALTGGVRKAVGPGSGSKRST